MSGPPSLRCFTQCGSHGAENSWLGFAHTPYVRWASAKPKRITEIDRITISESILIHATRNTERVFLSEPPSVRIEVAVPPIQHRRRTLRVLHERAKPHLRIAFRICFVESWSEVRLSLCLRRPIDFCPIAGRVVSTRSIWEHTAHRLATPVVRSETRLSRRIATDHPFHINVRQGRYVSNLAY